MPLNNLNVRIEEMLGFIDMNGAYGFDDSKIEELESIILDCNSLQAHSTTNLVADSIYDTLYDMLKQVKPSSGVLSEIWEEDGDITDYTELLIKNPMMSIETAKSYDCKALTDFINRMPEEETSYFASYKINGHGIRVVYKDGYLVSATSRARASAGRDITRHLKVLLGDYCKGLEDWGLVELRGELCLPIGRLEEARTYNPAIKSAFSAVSSLVRPSSTEEEIRLLDFLCYGFIADGISFEEREEEFQQIESCGFSTPQYILIESAGRDDLKDLVVDVIKAFEDNYEEFGYFCDGVVFECNNRQLFEELGTSGNHNNGNVALKVGIWEQVSYPGIVQKILWTRGKSKLSPVAIVADEPGILVEDENGKMMNWEELGVLTAQGNKVRRVPLYEPKNILILDAYVGNVLYFRYGGEAGVVPCFPDGRLLKEDAAREVILGEEVTVDLDTGEEVDASKF